MLDYPASSGQLPPEISYSQGSQASQEGISNGNQAENKRYGGRNVGSRPCLRDPLTFVPLTRNIDGARRLSQFADQGPCLYWST
jgi:hypothetical protein